MRCNFINAGINHALGIEINPSFKSPVPEVADCGQEGPNVFELGGKILMISDFWNGLAVYTSEDYTHWTRCEDI